MKLNSVIYFNLRLALFLAINLSLTAHAETCDQSILFEYLKRLKNVVQLNNCYIEIVRESFHPNQIESETSDVDVFLLYIEDRRLSQSVLFEVWPTSECESKYDHDKNRIWYTDFRNTHGARMRRYLNLELSRNGHLRSLEVGVQDYKNWAWQSRVICNNNFFEMGGL